MTDARRRAGFMDAAAFVLTLEGKRGPEIAELISAYVADAVAQALEKDRERIWQELFEEGRSISEALRRTVNIFGGKP